MTHLEIAIEAVKKAGEVILSYQNTSAFETKSDGSHVTAADMASNTVIISILEKTGIPILSEEGIGISSSHNSDTPLGETAQGYENTSQTLSSYPERLWIIDPLDGTKDFIANTDGFSVMIGLLEHGRPVIGAVFAPRLGTLYYAEKNKGAFFEKDGSIERLTIHPSHPTKLRFIRSVHNFTPFMESVAKKLDASLHPQGSIGIKAGVVAQGNGDFFFSLGKLGEWDVCAPEIILTESGGMVTDISGAPLFYGTLDHRVTKGIIFSNSHCHEEVLKAISDAQSDISPTTD